MPKEGAVRKSRNVAAIILAVTMMSAPRALTVEQVDKWMSELSNWGRWGKDDQRGTLNLMTPAVRKDALKLAREGVSVSLAHMIEKERAADNPRPLGQADGTPIRSRASPKGTASNGPAR